MDGAFVWWRSTVDRQWTTGPFHCWKRVVVCACGGNVLSTAFRALLVYFADAWVAEVMIITVTQIT